MQNAATIRSLLESHGLRPNKALGQNFLIEPAHVRKLVEASDAQAGDLVVEIGPGTGVLTDHLVDRECHVIACELDAGMAGILRERFASEIGAGRLTLIEGDCLASKHDLHAGLLDAIAGRSFRLVANLPYGAASPLMIMLATRHHPAFRATGAPACLGQYVTIQRDVAQRLRAPVGTKDYSEMSVLVQATCRVKRIALLPPGCFWPAPKIDSEMVSIVPIEPPLADDIEPLAALCRELFTHRRKQIGSILGRERMEALTRLLPDLDRTRRPEQFEVKELIALSIEWARLERENDAPD